MISKKKLQESVSVCKYNEINKILILKIPVIP
jgi:hypothetical protein